MNGIHCTGFLYIARESYDRTKRKLFPNSNIFVGHFVVICMEEQSTIAAFLFSPEEKMG